MPAMEPAVEATEQAVLEQLLAEGAVQTEFQPMVALDSGQVLAFEALSRGSAGSALERPGLLFAAARHGRRLRELDIACRRRAASGQTRRAVRLPAGHAACSRPGLLNGQRRRFRCSPGGASK